MEIILAFMNQYQITPYDEKTGEGLLRHTLIRYGFTTKEIMVCLVINGAKIPHSEKLMEILRQNKWNDQYHFQYQSEKYECDYGRFV